MKFLEDDEIRLRAVEPGDASLMWEVENDSSHWRDNGMAAPYSHHNLQEYALNYDADPIRAGQLRLVCEYKSGEVIGLLDLYEISPIGRTAFVGIYIIARHRHSGLAARCLALAERYSHQLLNLRILGAKVAAGNDASRELFERSGYERAGELKNWLLSGTHQKSLYLYTKPLS